MLRLLGGAATAALCVTGAYAGGLDRSSQSIGILFEEGNYAEVSAAFAFPKLSGKDTDGTSVKNVGNDFNVGGAGIKFAINDKFDFALIFDQPYGADVEYGPETAVLGGTFAEANATSWTGLLRYKFDDRISVYGGPRYLKADGHIGLSGTAYPALPFPYDVEFASDSAFGYVVGAAYEIPEIAFRAALTYTSEIDLTFTSTETFTTPFGAVPFGTSVGETDSEIPKAITLDLQSGIAADTLLFGSIRWTEWSAFTLAPPNLDANLAELDDTTTYTIGVGRKFTDKFSGSVSFIYEDGGSDSLVSPLAPSNGQKAISVGGRYQVNDQVRLSGGVRYTWLGDARPETGTPDVERGKFTDNTALSVGFKLGYSF